MDGFSRWCALASVALLAGCQPHDERACSPAREYWHNPAEAGELEPLRNRVTLRRDGKILWNGFNASNDQIAQLLAASHKLTPEPGVYLEAEMGASCADLDRMRNQMDTALQCRIDGRKCLEGLPDGYPHSRG
jgi:hypothetical protein